MTTCQVGISKFRPDARFVVQVGSGIKYSPDQPRDERGRFEKIGDVADTLAKSLPSFEKLRASVPAELKGDERWNHPAQQELNDVVAYTASSRGINGLLSGRLKPDDMDKKELADVTRRITTLDRAIGRGALPQDTTVYRGMSLGDQQISPGSIIRNGGFTSTSLNPESASHFPPNPAVRYGDDNIARDADRLAVIEISAPKGLPAFYADGDGKEVILPRGLALRVTDVSPTTVTTEIKGVAHTQQLIKAEVVGVG